MATPGGVPVYARKYEEDDFLDLIEGDALDAAEPDEMETNYSEPAIDLDDALSELNVQISDAEDFILSDMMPDWEDAEAFYDGESDVPKEKGRSQATKTVVRDTIRALKPSAMRIFVQADKIVEYEPVEAMNYGASMIASQQTLFVNQLFWRQNGYKVLYNAIHNAFLKKAGIMKAYYSEYDVDQFMRLSNLTPEQLSAMEQMPDVTIISLEETGYEGNQTYSAEVSLRKSEGKICLDHVPLYEFFVDDAAIGVDEGEYKVCGQRRNVTVSEARSMGLEYDGDWQELSSFDVEDYEASTESTIRRGYTKDHDSDKHNLDPANHSFLLTEAYMRFDLDGTGISQLYRFWLGGIDQQYLDHERVSENPYGVAQIDPMPDAFFGRSIFDVLLEDQNTQTSLMRATIDNAHASNNTRLAYHETMVNSRDVNSKVLGHPIRFRQPGMIQEIGVQPMVGAMLPLMQYLDMETQTKAGSTNAAMGLDPDALQSTDKDAVKNTIQLSQGQIELMCRNICETGLKVIFDKLLRLSIRHNPRNQVIEVNGDYVPVDQSMFTPDAPMATKVGLGMPDVQTQLMGLERIAMKQEEMMGRFGMNNPVCNVNQYFATITDMSRLLGLPNIGRYFSQITPEVAQQLDQMTQQQAEAAKQEPPNQTVLMAENIRAQAKVEEQRLENIRQHETQASDTRTKMIELMMKDDYERDKMAQDLAVDDAKITQTGVDKAFVEYEQNVDRDYKMQQFLLQQEEQRRQFMETQRMQERQAQQQPAPQPSGPGGPGGPGGGQIG